jgi:hypothetical protein
VECDEDQHKYNNPECEFSRMINLTQSYHTPVYWIRFNPDAYVGKQQYNLNQRLSHLGKVVNEAIEFSESDEDLEFTTRVQYLFYDGNDQQYHDYSESDVMNLCRR